MLQRALTVLNDNYPVLRLYVMEGNDAESVHFYLGFEYSYGIVRSLLQCPLTRQVRASLRVSFSCKCTDLGTVRKPNGETFLSVIASMNHNQLFEICFSKNWRINHEKGW